MTTDDVDAAWDAVREALPDGWIVGCPAYRVESLDRAWHVSAIDLRLLAKQGEYVEATGSTAAESLRRLAGMLTGLRS